MHELRWRWQNYGLYPIGDMYFPLTFDLCICDSREGILLFWWCLYMGVVILVPLPSWLFGLFSIGLYIYGASCLKLGSLLWCPFTPFPLDYVIVVGWPATGYKRNIYEMMHTTGFDFNPLSSSTRLGVGVLVLQVWQDWNYVIQVVVKSFVWLGGT
jgi:hypothetical protein